MVLMADQALRTRSIDRQITGFRTPRTLHASCSTFGLPRVFAQSDQHIVLLHWLFSGAFSIVDRFAPGYQNSLD
jgi:hypothetical protein